jgi:hypothetical protein
VTLKNHVFVISAELIVPRLCYYRPAAPFSITENCLALSWHTEDVLISMICTNRRTTSLDWIASELASNSIRAMVATFCCSSADVVVLVVDFVVTRRACFS